MDLQLSKKALHLAHDNVNSLVNRMNYKLSVVQSNDLHVLGYNTGYIIIRRARRSSEGHL